MIKEPIQIKFENSQNPKAGFDLIKLEDLFIRKHIDHSPEVLHRVDFFILLIIESGQGTHTIDFTEYKYKQGTILTIRKDQFHKFHANKKVIGSMLLFTDEFLESYLEKLEALKCLQLFNEILAEPIFQLQKKEFASILALVSRISQEYFKINDDQSFGIIRSELQILIAKLYRIKSKKNLFTGKRKYLNEFINFQNLVEQNVTKYSKVMDYAKIIGVSTKTLNTITKHIINKTAKEIIDNIYTNRIKRLLINTELSVKEIAYESGFEESTNFYKYFKRQTKMTPEQFRESLH